MLLYHVSLSPDDRCLLTKKANTSLHWLFWNNCRAKKAEGLALK